MPASFAARLLWRPGDPRYTGETSKELTDYSGAASAEGPVGETPRAL